MAFLSPWFLLGLLAVGLPLWLHRLEKQTAERRAWSSLAFFRPSTETSTRHRRYRYLVLLACRLLLLTALALLFARPALDARSTLLPPGGRWHVIAIDTSLSMGHGPAWTQARAEVDRILSGLGGGDRSQVLAFGPGVRVLGGATGNHGSWRGAVATLAPTVSRASYGELGEGVRALAQDQATALTLHVVSDLQRSAAPERFADLSLPPGATLVIHDVAAAARPNWGIENVTGQTRLHGAAPAELQVTIVGFDTPAAKRRVELRVGGAPVDAKEVALPAAGRASVHFSGFEVPRGHGRAEVRIHPADDLPADDVYFIALERTDALPVLFVREASESRAELYYRTALESGGAGMFELHAVTAEAAQTLPLDRYAFVVLYDLPRLPGPLDARLRAFVEGGRSALIVTGDRTVRSRTLPWAGEVLSDSGRSDRAWHAVADASAHPIVRGSEGLAEVRFLRHLRAEAAAERVVARLSDGSPLLYDVPLGAGRLLVLTSPFDTGWNDWVVHASFVPFAVSSARWLAGLEGTKIQKMVDDVLDVGQGPTSSAASIEVIGPDGRRALGLAASVSERKVPLRQSGFYEIRRPGRTDEVAANPDTRESDLRALDAETLTRWKSTGGGPVRPGSETRKPEPRELFRPLAFLLAAAVLAESTLANRYLRR
jgi:hypothetical protein